MPGPQGPEVDKTTSSSSTISKADSNATEIGKTEAPKSSPTDDTNQNTSVKNSSTDPTASGSSSAANNGTSASANTKTNVTSTQGQRVAGFRYYRDIGKQN
jgi:hypothetical protein